MNIKDKKIFEMVTLRERNSTIKNCFFDCSNDDEWKNMNKALEKSNRKIHSGGVNSKELTNLTK